jgi:hypothetical protein
MVFSVGGEMVSLAWLDLVSAESVDRVVNRWRQQIVRNGAGERDLAVRRKQ